MILHCILYCMPACRSSHEISTIFPLVIDNDELFPNGNNPYFASEILNVAGSMSYPVHCVRNRK